MAIITRINNAMRQSVGYRTPKSFRLRYRVEPSSDRDDTTGDKGPAHAGVGPAAVGSNTI